jgi:ketosteroid isomerase-like protein
MMTGEEAVREHARALIAHDREALAEGFADDAVFLVGGSAMIGKEAIRAMFDNVPDDALPTEVTFDTLVSAGEYVYTTYHHDDGMSGGDTFHVRDGLIVMQSAHVVNVPDELAKHTPLDT